MDVPHDCRHKFKVLLQYLFIFSLITIKILISKIVQPNPSVFQSDCLSVNLPICLFSNTVAANSRSCFNIYSFFSFVTIKILISQLSSLIHLSFGPTVCLSICPFVCLVILSPQIQGLASIFIHFFSRYN